MLATCRAPLIQLYLINLTGLNVDYKLWRVLTLFGELFLYSTGTAIAQSV
jgi:hypothetical protein